MPHVTPVVSPSLPAPRGRVRAFALLAAVAAVPFLLQGCGDNVVGDTTSAAQAADAVYRSNGQAIDASGVDHTKAAPDCLGPCRAARALAVVQIAVFEAVNAIDRRYAGYPGMNTPAAVGAADMRAAIAQATHDTLVGLFPQQVPTFDTALQNQRALIPDGPAKTNGMSIGAGTAAAILALRTGDTSTTPEPLVGAGYITGTGVGEWRKDPVSTTPGVGGPFGIALGANWPTVTPFALTSGSQFRVPAPPALTSPEYTTAYNEVQAVGSLTSATRTAAETFAGIFWAYDGTPTLCAPPRLYNQITTELASQQGLDVTALAHLLALTNIAMADAGIACWDSKFFHKFWRPITAIRESDAGTGPSGLGDGNAATVGDPAWQPLGAPHSNVTVAVNFTPPFPGYPSGHGTFGGALFQVFRREFGTDAMPFTFVSDEFNGVNKDNTGAVRPLMPKTFATFTEAEEENGQSRIYLGIHFAFDKTAAITLGNQVGNWTVDHLLLPLP